ncbi:MAG: hypothetical protein KF785_06725 [Gemmatimonadales bacterium]|nr:hypothetical protein [Gemmatimonadales bacterium]
MDRVLANTAAALREGIVRGFLANADAIDWARGEVGDDPEDTSILLSELALAANQPPSRILNILGQLAWGADLAAAGRIAVSYLHDRLDAGAVDLDLAIEAIHHLARDGFAPDPWFERGARRFHDDKLPSASSPVDPMSALVGFLVGYRHDAPGAAIEPQPAAHDQFVIALDPSAPELTEAEVSVAWQSWSGRARIRTSAAELTSFANALRDFAGHRTNRISFAPSPGVDGDQLTATVVEYGRARRAAILIEVTATDQPAELHQNGNQLRAAVPTEHALLGDFAADLGELISTGGGVARLRLSARWPHDS